MNRKRVGRFTGIFMALVLLFSATAFNVSVSAVNADAAVFSAYAPQPGSPGGTVDVYLRLAAGADYEIWGGTLSITYDQAVLYRPDDTRVTLIGDAFDAFGVPPVGVPAPVASPGTTGTHTFYLGFAPIGTTGSQDLARIRFNVRDGVDPAVVTSTTVVIGEDPTDEIAESSLPVPADVSFVDGVVAIAEDLGPPGPHAITFDSSLGGLGWSATVTVTNGTDVAIPASSLLVFVGSPGERPIGILVDVPALRPRQSHVVDTVITTGSQGTIISAFNLATVPAPPATLTILDLDITGANVLTHGTHVIE